MSDFRIKSDGPLFRVVSLFAGGVPHMAEIARISNETFIAAFSRLMNKSSITCVRTGLVIEAGPTPTAVVLDVRSSNLTFAYSHSY